MKIEHRREDNKIVFYRIDHEWIDENGEKAVEEEEVAILFLKDDEVAQYVEENEKLMELLKEDLFEVETNAKIPY